MKIRVDFPIPLEFFLPGARGVVYSRCSVRTQLLDLVVCSLLSLRNPYFDLNLRRKLASQFVAHGHRDGALEVATTHLAEANAYESVYRLEDTCRVVVTEVRGSRFHGRYFHAQRVLAMIARDLDRMNSGDHA